MDFNYILNYVEQKESFEDILNYVQANESDLTVLNVGSCYFTAENKEGYRADFEIGKFEMAFITYETGNAYSLRDRFITTGKNATIHKIVESLYKALEESKRRTDKNKRIRAYRKAQKCKCEYL
ncbi:hypothetical protein AT268_33320 [Bacillus cereus]|uniref:Uncharacterized protein n=1 Tax=Bacillus cereus TaxID=1396 RepID=A0A9X0MK39_BACCE|nr:MULTISPECIES: hypothetical protein [Bacillus cereus group]PEZ74912.1 hypothetical protein CN410_12325 [Bacillus anthracis]KXY51358.1 hypothetical protein AT268_33320 [Bacillus cereus]PES55297.1 hypothetical protein CN515_04420 [Bacillus cereus]PFA29696.1 hypothetical protein CN384_08440 [Bacillus thuringiensis]PGW11071.1 hypothetical protein COD97_15895 [Bacillus cereus]